MLQIRVHGQGVLTASKRLSVAAFEQRHHAQAFLRFGCERTGAPLREGSGGSSIPANPLRDGVARPSQASH